LIFYNGAKELIERELPRNVRSQLYPFFETGVKAYLELVNENRKFFESDFASNIKGWLLNYLIFRQFEGDMVNQNFPFIAQPVKVNRFRYFALNLLHNNVIINVARAATEDSLPNPSKYRERNCKLNRFNAKQLFCDPGNDNELTVKNEPYYMFLTYRVRNNEVDFVSLIVPNSDMTNCLEKVNLKSELSLYQIDSEPIHEEKKIIKLKTEVIQSLHQLNLSKGEA
jgi:hypothetical protein